MGDVAPTRKSEGWGVRWEAEVGNVSATHICCQCRSCCSSFFEGVFTHAHAHNFTQVWHEIPRRRSTSVFSTIVGASSVLEKPVLSTASQARYHVKLNLPRSIAGSPKAVQVHHLLHIIFMSLHKCTTGPASTLPIMLGFGS